MNIGYACINMSLGESVTTNRTVRKEGFRKLGENYISKLTLANVIDLVKIMEWNVERGIHLFRMSSDMVPWGDEVELSKLRDYDRISTVLRTAGDLARDGNIRLTFHPGPFVVLGSPNSWVVKNSIRNLELHGQIMDIMGLVRTTYNKINIHCNGTYGDKVATMKRFSEVFNGLTESVRSRLTVENDDKASMYSVMDLISIYEDTGMPIVFDYLHHKFCDGGLSEKDALDLAVSTWDGITPVVHYAESREGKNPRAHADYITSLPDTYGNDVDIMVEAKAKDLAIIKDDIFRV